MITYTDIKNDGLFRSVLLSQIVVVIEVLLTVFMINDSLIIDVIRYTFNLIASFSLVTYMKSYHQKTNIVQKLFMMWIIFLFITSFYYILDEHQNYINLKLFLSTYLFLYLIPFFMAASPGIEFYEKLIKLCYILAILYLILSIPIYLVSYGTSYFSELLTSLAEGATLIILTLSYHNNGKKKLIVISSIIICIVIMMLLARRNKVLFFGGNVIITEVLWVLKSKLSAINKTIIVLLSVIAVFIIFNTSAFSLFFERVETGMSSRELVIELFVDDFNRTPSDWIWGRGIFGTFDGGDIFNDNFTDSRSGIENGYLQLILKGGLVWVLLLCLISLISFYRGFFKSNNMLCKSFAMYIFLYYIDMIGFGIPTTSLKYILVFVAIGACNNKWLRACSDKELSDEIGLK